jgi:hypothetical protein
VAAAALVYDLPDLPHVPRPQTGNVYRVLNHGGVVFCWTKEELWANRALSAAAFSLGIVWFFAGWRLGFLKWRK